MNLIIQIGLLIIGFTMLVKGADYFVDGAAGIATKFGIPQLVVGLTIVALGTSLPELAAAVLLWVATIRKRELNRPWGIIMLVCYAAYFVYLLQLG